MPVPRKLHSARPSPKVPMAKASSSANPVVVASTVTPASRWSQRKGKGNRVVNDIVGGAIPEGVHPPAVEDGILEAIKSGLYAGFQVIDIKVSITDGSFHEVDSNELAFKMAGIFFALKDAFGKAGPILLEPIMKVEVTTPDDDQGDILGDVNPPGVIQGVDAKAGQTIVTANVP